MYLDDHLNVGPIDNIHELSEVITAVVNRILTVVTENTSTGQYYVGYDDVSDIICEQDYLTYFDLIESELAGREEVLDLDTDDHTFDVVCGLAWCKNYELMPDEDFEFGYEQLRDAPSLSRLAEIGRKALEHLVLEASAAKFKAEDLGISNAELEYVRNSMGLDRNKYAEHTMLPVMSKTLITAESYENLQIASASYTESLQHGGKPDAYGNPFKVCVNELGQIIDSALSDELKEQYRHIFEQRKSFSSNIYGAMVCGQPTVILCHDVAHPLNDPYQHHAVTALMCGYARAMMREANVHITYGCGIGEDDKDELMAIVPSGISAEHLRAFDEKFAAVMKSIPNTINVYWAAAYYDCLLGAVKDKMSHDQHISPWTRDNPEQAAIHACEALGEYIGEHQYEIDQAKLTHNMDKLLNLSAKLDVRRTPETCEKMTAKGIFNADRDLSRRLRLYTAELGNDESFLLPKGQLLLAMKEMGCEPGLSPFVFMDYCSAEDCREVRSFVQDLPRLSLFQQVRYAQQRSEQQEAGDKKPPTPEKER